jgi:hypothetical protein
MDNGSLPFSYAYWWVLVCIYWFQITGEAPDNAMKVEVTGKQYWVDIPLRGERQDFWEKVFP